MKQFILGLFHKEVQKTRSNRSMEIRQLKWESLIIFSLINLLYDVIHVSKLLRESVGVLTSRCILLTKKRNVREMMRYI